MRKSISARYFYSMTLLLFSGIIVMGLMIVFLTVDYFKNDKTRVLENTVDNTLRIFNEYSEDNTVFESAMKAAAIFRDVQVTARATENLIFITDADGVVLMCNDETMAEHYSETSLPSVIFTEAQTNGMTSGVNNFGSTSKAESYYYAAKPVLTADGEIQGFVVAMSDANSLVLFMSDILFIFFISAGLMLVFSNILSIWVTARMTTPLRNMALAADRFGKGDFSVRVEEEGDDEIAKLSRSFNTMAQSLEKIDSSRSSFMGNIAHELRTPMTTIKGFVDGILDGTIPKDSTDHYLSIVSEESGRLTRLIKNMLDITKLESEEYNVNAVYYDVWESITGVVFAAESRIAEKKIKVNGFVPVRTMCYADPDLIYQVIYNLFDNALKFCPEEGEITLLVTTDKQSVTVKIRNTGDGISEESLPYVFERFYKEDKSRGLNTMGSGLGLHICKVLIGLSGGHILVDSYYGVDCTFSFSVPFEPPCDKADGGKNTQQNRVYSYGNTRQLPCVNTQGQLIETETEE